MIFRKYIPGRRELVVILGAALIVLTFVLISSGQEESKFTPVERDERIWLNQIWILLIGSLLTFLTGLFWWQKKKALSEKESLSLDRQKVADRLHEVELALAGITQQVIPITAAFQAILIKDLTHFHTPEMDGLMKKIGPPYTLTAAEGDRLFNVLLPQRELDMGPLIDEDEADKAHILPAVVRLAQSEAKKIIAAEEMKLQLVNVAAVVGVPVAAVINGEEKK